MLSKIPFTALSKSASSKTMTGDFPPNSRDTCAKFSAEFRITCLAVCGPPVKLMRSTKGWLVNVRPQGSPCPVTILITPGGKPASSNTFANSSMGAEACSEAFRTTVFPAASAGPIFTATRNSWEFQGTTAATTPKGSRRVIVIMSGLSMGNVSPLTLSARPA